MLDPADMNLKLQRELQAAAANGAMGAMMEGLMGKRQQKWRSTSAVGGAVGSGLSSSWTATCK